MLGGFRAAIRLFAADVVKLDKKIAELLEREQHPVAAKNPQGAYLN